jgi:hypothetical protein
MPDIVLCQQHGSICLCLLDHVLALYLEDALLAKVLDLPLSVMLSLPHCVSHTQVATQPSSNCVFCCLHCASAWSFFFRGSTMPLLSRQLKNASLPAQHRSLLALSMPPQTSTMLTTVIAIPPRLIGHFFAKTNKLSPLYPCQFLLPIYFSLSSNNPRNIERHPHKQHTHTSPQSTQTCFEESSS